LVNALEQISTALRLPMSNTLACDDILGDTDDDEQLARTPYADCSAGDTTGCCLSSSLRPTHGTPMLPDAELALQVGGRGSDRSTSGADDSVANLQRHHH
jgi:hypothetical protein